MLHEHWESQCSTIGQWTRGAKWKGNCDISDKGTCGVIRKGTCDVIGKGTCGVIGKWACGVIGKGAWNVTGKGTFGGIMKVNCDVSDNGTVMS